MGRDPQSSLAAAAAYIPDLTFLLCAYQFPPQLDPAHFQLLRIKMVQIRFGVHRWTGVQYLRKSVQYLRRHPVASGGSYCGVHIFPKPVVQLGWVFAGQVGIHQAGHDRTAPQVDHLFRL